METDFGAMDIIQLYQAYLRLNERRMEIDKLIITQSNDHDTREELWAETETVMRQLNDIVDRLMYLPASSLPELRAKAAVLAPLMDGTGPDLADYKKTGLTLSLTDDVSSFSLRRRERTQ